MSSSALVANLPPTAYLLIVVFSSCWWLFSKLLGQVRPKGRRLGVASSNLSDEFEYPAGGTEDRGEWKVKSLWIFPVKSCRGIELSEARVASSGLEHDRQFMLAEHKRNPKSGFVGWNFITQRQYPQMARIATEIFVDSENPVTGGTLAITYPLAPSKFPTFGFRRLRERTLHAPLAATEKAMLGCPLVQVGIWKDLSLAYDISAPVRSELDGLSRFLGTRGPLKLFRSCNEKLRPVFRNAPRIEEVGYQPVTGFADAYPLHMMNIASVRDVNSRIRDKISDLSAVRFRANIIISGPKAFHEDDWKLVSFGGRVYYAACRTARCTLPNVDQDTGERHMTEPDRIMRSYRKIDEGCKNSACLGMQLVPAEKEGVIRTGDSVVVLKTGEHSYVPQ